jgi:hypothetical protein
MLVADAPGETSEAGNIGMPATAYGDGLALPSFYARLAASRPLAVEGTWGTLADEHVSDRALGQSAPGSRLTVRKLLGVWVDPAEGQKLELEALDGICEALLPSGRCATAFLNAAADPPVICVEIRPQATVAWAGALRRAGASTQKYEVVLASVGSSEAAPAIRELLLAFDQPTGRIELPAVPGKFMVEVHGRSSTIGSIPLDVPCRVH